MWCVHSGDVGEWRNNSGLAVVCMGVLETLRTCLYMIFVEKSFSCLLALEVEIQCV